MSRDCNACEDLRQNSAEFVQNGVTDNVCASLKNNTGFNPSSGHDDCTDLHNANDCLVGNMEDEIEAYDVCDWKEYMKKFVPNVWTTLKAIICSICGLWIKLEQTAYMGILTLYTSKAVNGTGKGNQAPAFNTNVRQGNVPTSVLSVASDYKGIVVKNTTSVPLFVETTFNSSINTGQHFASTFLVVTKDGSRIGQTPFITPDTYDQQVMAEPFILQPGQSATMRYYFRIGHANTWFIKQFGYSDSKRKYVKCRLDPNVSSDPENQRSYFSVKVTSIVDFSASAGTN